MESVNLSDKFNAWCGATMPLSVAVALTSFFAGCGGEEAGDAATKLVVVTTTTHVTDMVRSVAGDRV